jgi:photosystem II stability/assembly factor-like uncharacterized protein
VGRNVVGDDSCQLWVRSTCRVPAAVVAVVAIIVALAGCTGVSSSSSRPSATAAPSSRSLTSALLPARSSRSVLAPTALAPVPSDGIPVGFGITNLSFVSSNVGWALGRVPCVVAKLRGSCSLIARTKDGGRTWSAIPTPLRDCSNFGSPCLVGLAFATPDVGYVIGAATMPQTSYIYVTHDGGASWSRQHSSTEAIAISGHTMVRVVPSTPAGRCAFICPPVIQRVSIGSTDWATVRLPDAPPGRATLTASSDRLALVVSGRSSLGLFVSDDAGLTWVHRNNPCPLGFNDSPSQYSVGLGSTLLAVCASVDGTQRVLVSADSGATFRAASSLRLDAKTVGPAALTAFFADVLVLSDTNGAVHRSTDTGRTWALLDVSTASDYSSLPDTVDSRVGFMLARDGTTLLRTTDAGARWQAIAVH